MDFHETFPLCYLLNLARRTDRRARCEGVFEDLDLTVRRFPAVDAKYVRRMRGFEAAGRYAHAVSTRMIIREAKRAGAPAVFIFEDDVVPAPDFHERLAEIELPEDWGMFYLGGQHHVRPEVVAPGLVRIGGMVDTHAWGVRAEFYEIAMRALEGRVDPPVGATLPAADVFLAKLHARVPSYATFPNLAWQEEEHSDLAGGEYSNYREDGTQKWGGEALAGVLAESLGLGAWESLAEREVPEPFYEGRWFRRQDVAELCKLPAPDERAAEGLEVGNLRHVGKIAFLFLTRGAHHHPEVWEEYWGARDGRVSVYAHSAERDGLGGSMAEAQIEAHLPTAWGEVSLVRAQLALLRAALADCENTHFVFASESCVPVRPLADLRRALELDSRSTFGWRRQEDLDPAVPSEADKARRARAMDGIPASYARFHSQWMCLDREAATLVAEDDATVRFVDAFAPDEFYFGTMLAVKGFPLEERVANRDITHAQWGAGGPHPETFDRVTAEQAAAFAASGCFFGRKFAPGCGIGEFGLHLPSS